MKLWMFIIAVLIALILALASPPAQAYSGHYYVIPSSVSLRECAAYNCAPLLTVYQGEKVEILERTSAWSKVRLVERSAMGWIPNELISYSPDLQAKPAPLHYVNTGSLPLRDAPRPNAKVLTTLNFNDEVEMLGVGTSGWAQVRELRSSLVGWVLPRYLSKAAEAAPKSSRRRPKIRKALPKEEEEPAQEAPALPRPM